MSWQLVRTTESIVMKMTPQSYWWVLSGPVFPGSWHLAQRTDKVETNSKAGREFVQKRSGAQGRWAAGDRQALGGNCKDLVTFLVNLGEGFVAMREVQMVSCFGWQAWIIEAVVNRVWISMMHLFL